MLRKISVGAGLLATASGSIRLSSSATAPSSTDAATALSCATRGVQAHRFRRKKIQRRRRKNSPRPAGTGGTETETTETDEDSTTRTANQNENENGIQQQGAQSAPLPSAVQLQPGDAAFPQALPTAAHSVHHAGPPGSPAALALASAGASANRRPTLISPTAQPRTGGAGAGTRAKEDFHRGTGAGAGIRKDLESVAEQLKTAANRSLTGQDSGKAKFDQFNQYQWPTEMLGDLAQQQQQEMFADSAQFRNVQGQESSGSSSEADNTSAASSAGNSDNEIDNMDVDIGDSMSGFDVAAPSSAHNNLKQSRFFTPTHADPSPRVQNARRKREQSPLKPTSRASRRLQHADSTGSMASSKSSTSSTVSSPDTFVGARSSLEFEGQRMSDLSLGAAAADNTGENQNGMGMAMEMGYSSFEMGFANGDDSGSEKYHTPRTDNVAQHLLRRRQKQEELVGSPGSRAQAGAGSPAAISPQKIQRLDGAGDVLGGEGEGGTWVVAAFLAPLRLRSRPRLTLRLGLRW